MNSIQYLPQSFRLVRNRCAIRIPLSHAEEGSGTLVEWTSSWESKADDAVEFCHGIYVALLAELAKSFDQ